jgi:hypothetical protein
VVVVVVPVVVTLVVVVGPQQMHALDTPEAHVAQPSPYWHMQYVPAHPDPYGPQGSATMPQALQDPHCPFAEAWKEAKSRKDKRAVADNEWLYGPFDGTLDAPLVDRDISERRAAG